MVTRTRSYVSKYLAPLPRFIRWVEFLYWSSMEYYFFVLLVSRQMNGITRQSKKTNKEENKGQLDEWILKILPGIRRSMKRYKYRPVSLLWNKPHHHHHHHLRFPLILNLPNIHSFNRNSKNETAIATAEPLLNQVPKMADTHRTLNENSSNQDLEAGYQQPPPPPPYQEQPTPQRVPVAVILTNLHKFQRLQAFHPQTLAMIDAGKTDEQIRKALRKSRDSTCLFSKSTMVKGIVVLIICLVFLFLEIRDMRDNYARCEKQ